MNEQQLAAVKQALEALEALEMVVVDIKTTPTAYEAHRQAITALQSIISQDALDWMAKNARDLGLSYDPTHDIVDIADIIAGELKVSRGTAYDMMREALKEAFPVQEPVAQSLKDAVFTVIEGFNIPHDVRKILESAYYNAPPAPQPVPVKTYHDGKPWPVAPKPWVGLTDEERNECTQSPFTADHHRAIETKLKEKNT